MIRGRLAFADLLAEQVLWQARALAQAGRVGKDKKTTGGITGGEVEKCEGKCLE